MLASVNFRWLARRKARVTQTSLRGSGEGDRCILQTFTAPESGDLQPHFTFRVLAMRVLRHTQGSGRVLGFPGFQKLPRKVWCASWLRSLCWAPGKSLSGCISVTLTVSTLTFMLQLRQASLWGSGDPESEVRAKLGTQSSVGAKAGTALPWAPLEPTRLS